MNLYEAEQHLIDLKAWGEYHRLFRKHTLKALDIAIEIVAEKAYEKDKEGIEAVKRLRQQDSGSRRSIDKESIAEAENPARLDISALNLTKRTILTLVRANINTIGELTALTDSDLLRVRGIGKAGYREIVEQLQKAGLTLKEDNQDRGKRLAEI